MNQKRPNFFVRFFGGIWRFVDGTRRFVFNLIFLFLLIAVLAAMFGGGGGGLQQDTALVLAPQGMVVEQYTADATERAVNELLGEQTPETRQRDLLTAIRKAKDDPKITQLVVRSDQIWGIGLSKLQELKSAIEDFKTSGKPVVSYALFMGQSHYYLAALADEVWLHPEGMLLLEGFGAYRNYYKDAMDKYGVDMHIFRAGEYKSYGEPYARSDMSPESKEANAYWLDGLWQDYLDDVAAMRGIDPAVLRDFVDNYDQHLRAASGDMAVAAFDAGLVDRLGSVDEFRARVADRGVADSDGYRGIDTASYINGDELVLPGQDQVAVVIAQGTILTGDQPPGTIGGESTSRLLRDAREDSAIKAIVLRVDSGGGGVLPSERIRHQVELARAEGKPVIVSMSSVAASGGYSIAMNADRIFASPTTITGSIGVFASLPKAKKLMGEVGVNTDGVGTTEWAGAFNLGVDLPPRVADVFQQSVDKTYLDFITNVAEARGLEVDAVDTVARGRVWSGAQALDRGLVDELGGLNDAVAAAASLAGLDDYTVRYVEPQPSTFERWLLDLSATHPGALDSLNARRWLPNWLANATEQAEIELLLHSKQGQLSMWSHCFCEPTAARTF